MMKHWFCLILILLTGCQKTISKSDFIEDWNRMSRLAHKNSGKCPDETNYNLNEVIQKYRGKELEILYDLIGLEDIDTIIETCMSLNLLQYKLKVFDINDTVHVFHYLKEYESFRYVYSSHHKGNRIDSKFSCESLEDKPKYFSVETKLNKGKIEGISILYQ